jgi:hypothetical protein
MLMSFAQDMFAGVSTEDFGVWPADDSETRGLGARRQSSCSELKASPWGRPAHATLDVGHHPCC